MKRALPIACIYLFSFINSNSQGTATINFSIPDTVCVNTPVNITNTSVGAATYYWNFCVADINTIPTGVNLGNIGGVITSPVYIDYVFDNGNYFGFISDNYTGNLLRLDFGNSLLNNPAIVNLGNFGGILPITLEGIQIVKNEGKWYAILVGGDFGSGSTPSIMKVEFGANITNPTPVASSWGNLGNMAYPHDLYLFNDNGIWYGFSANTYNNTITEFNFTNSFSNTPTATNLGNIGVLASPTGLYTVNDNGNWYVFVTNAALPGSGTNLTSLTRLDFGNSLLNVPTGTNLGNPGNLLNIAWDISLIKSCGNLYGYVINAANNELLKLDFNGNITNTPVITSLGNVGNLSFPHCLSKLFRVGSDIFTFIGNVNNSTITRIQFQGCTNANTPASALQNPTPILYDKTGTYNINLTIDDGLPTQDALCKQVVVIGPPPKSPIKNVNVCISDSLKIGTGISAVSYNWNNGKNNDSIFVKNTGTYWVDLSNYGCTSRDSFLISILPPPIVNLGNDSSICKLDSIVLNATNNGSTYLWQDGSTNQKYSAKTAGNFFVTVTNNNGCKAKDTITVFIYPSPVIGITPDTSICKNSAIYLLASGGASYIWSPSITLNNSAISNPVASPLVNTTYKVKIKDTNGCSNTDSVKISIRPDPLFTINAGTTMCFNNSVILGANGGNLYSWQPSGSLNNASISNPTASPISTTTYTVQITDTVCGASSSLSTTVTVSPSPVVKANKSNDIDCSVGFSQLTAVGASSYQWTPATTLNNPNISNPVANPRIPTKYIVKGTNIEGCSSSDSIMIDVKAINKGLFLMPGAFTPNNDGLNDCYSAKTWGFLTAFDFSIFNRWGERVFHTTNQSQCWDGTYKGVQQKADVYVYIIRAKSLCEESVFRKGTFALIR